MKKRLKEVCEFYSGTGFPIKYQGDSYGDLPFYKVSDIANNEIMGNCFLDVCNNYISYDTVREIKGTVIPRNVVVFAKIGEALKLNRRCITSSDCLIDNNVMGIGCNEKYLDIKYFYFFMKNLKIEKLAESTTIPSVRKTKLEELFIEVPNMELQLEIARTLEVIQDIILYRQKQLIQMDKLIKARFVEMFCNKGYPVLGWNDVFNTTTGKLDSNAMVENGDYPFFTCAKDVFRIDKYAFEQEALILAGNNAAGKYDVKYYKGKFNAYQRTYILSLKQDWSYRLFQYQLEDKLVYLQKQSLGGLTKYLTLKILGDLSFIIPPIDKQAYFEKFVEQVNKSKLLSVSQPQIHIYKTLTLL
nr:restriction endonuclease subunit S [uncultured Lachnoanaerobaculum sp.]